MEKIPEQTCWRCISFEVEFEPDWSEVTPGAEFKLRCQQGHYDHSSYVTQEEFAQSMEFGFTCPDYSARIVQGSDRQK
jgi:hypothetical protein